MWTFITKLDDGIYVLKYPEKFTQSNSVELMDDWIDIEYSKSIEELANKLIPTLGTDAFFELF